MASHTALTRLIDHYCCPKCNNRTCHTEEVMLSAGGASTLGKVLGLGNGKYVAIICNLCGYSEFYNLRVLVADPEQAGAQKTRTAPTPPTHSRVADD